jgi:hypothetical protein
MIYAFVALSLVLAGVGAGILAVLALAIHREDKDYSLITVTRPGRLASGARIITSAYAHWPEPAQPDSYPQHELALSGHGQPPH